MQSKIKICKTIIFANLGNVKSKIAQNLSYRFFTNVGSKCDSPQRTIGFRAILDQRQIFTTLDDSWIAHALYLSTRSCDAMNRKRKLGQDGVKNRDKAYY